MSSLQSKPMFEPKAWRLTEQESELTTLARGFGEETLAGRAHRWDTEATFPLENYHDMHRNGLLGIGVQLKGSSAFNQRDLQMPLFGDH